MNTRIRAGGRAHERSRAEEVVMAKAPGQRFQTVAPDCAMCAGS